MNANKSFVSVVIPVYNSENTIGPLVANIIDTLEKYYRLEVILINDGSRDHSEEVCAGLHEKYPTIVRFFSLAKNVGEHNAVMAGLNQVTGDYAVIMDDDGQNLVSEALKLLQTAIGSDYDVVYTYYDQTEQSWWRIAGSWFNDKVASVMLNKPKDLYLCSFKAINKFLIREIIKYDLPYPYIDGLILRTTDKIGKILVKHNPREQGKSGYTLKKLVQLWLNMFVNFSILPLRAAMLCGFVFSVVGLALGIYVLAWKIANPELAGREIGWASIMISIVIFAGVQLISIGMIGEYVGRIFLSQNRKPQYTIRKAFEGSRKN